MALTFDQIDAHVQRRIIPKLIDQVYIGNPFLVKLLAKCKIEFDSGKSIAQPILYGKKNWGSYEGLDKFNTQITKTRNLADWNWKNFYVNITIVGDDLDKIEGDMQILGLVTNEVKEAEMTAKDALSTMLYSTNVGAKDFNSLDQAIGTTNTYGGISPADLGDTGSGDGGVWSSVVDTTGGALTLSRVKNLIGKATYDTEVPDLIMTTQTLYDALWALVQPSQRYLDPSSALARVGFSGIQIDKTQILVDRHIQAGYMYGINTNWMKLVCHKKKWMKWTGNKEMMDADGYVRQLLSKGNFICQARKFHFKATGLTA